MKDNCEHPEELRTREDEQEQPTRKQERLGCCLTGLTGLV